MRATWAAAALTLAMLGCDDDPAAEPSGGDATAPSDAGLRADAGTDAAPCEPVPERCDGVDEDCDGTIDEGFGLGRACAVGEGPCAVEGVFVCAEDGAAAVCGAEALPAQPEICDEADNDCDGAVDEGLALDRDPLNCGGCGVVCALDNAEVACEGGTCAVSACLAGFADPNAAADDGCECAVVGDEICDGRDDDCDGEIDEGLGLGRACTVGLGRCARVGQALCGDDGLASACDAEPGAPADELCNGFDDDCDGAIDEGFDADGDDAPRCADVPCDGGPCPEGVDCDVVCPRQDCAPDDPAVFPEALDLCGDGVDQNCDGRDAPCGEVHSLMTQLAVVAAGAAAPGCRDFDGDGAPDNAFAALAVLANGQLAGAIQQRQLVLLPTAEGLPVGAVDGRFELSILRGTPVIGGGGQLAVAPDSYDAEGVPLMRFANARLVAGDLVAGPGDFQLGLPLPGGAPGDLRVTNALITGAMQVEAEGLRIADGVVSGVVTEADLQVAVAILDPALVPLLLNLLQPDLDLDADGEADAYSACITYAAEPADIVSLDP